MTCFKRAALQSARSAGAGAFFMFCAKPLVAGAVTSSFKPARRPSALMNTLIHAKANPSHIRAMSNPLRCPKQFPMKQPAALAVISFQGKYGANSNANDRATREQPMSNEESANFLIMRFVVGHDLRGAKLSRSASERCAIDRATSKESLARVEVAKQPPSSCAIGAESADDRIASTPCTRRRGSRERVTTIC